MFRPVRAGGLKLMIDVNESQGAELAAPAHERVCEYRRIDAAAEGDDHARLRSREPQEFDDGTESCRGGVLGVGVCVHPGTAG